MKRETPRGYLLIEAVIAGVIASLALFLAMDLVSAARVQSSSAGNRQTAAAVARAKIDEAVSALPAGIADGALQPVPNVPAMRWRWTTTDDAALASASTPPLPSASVKRVTVAVEYPGERGRETLTLTQTWAE